MQKIIIDTNVIISHLISKKISQTDRIFDLVFDGTIIAFITEEVWSELIEKIQSPRIKPMLNRNTAKFIAQYKYAVTKIQAATKLSICRDPKDDKFLELAQDSQADYLITGDQDLLILRNHLSTKIITISEFTQSLTI